MVARQGTKHHAAKMTPAKVRQARKSYQVIDKKTGKRKWTITKLAHKYGIAHQTMYAILTFRTWKHVA
jgi:hypothetical protein